MFGIHKRTMRNTSRSSISLTIKTLDQKHLLRCLLIQIVPFMARSMTHWVSFSFAVGINKFDWNKIFFINWVGSRNTKGIFKDCLDGSPNIDDLETSFEESLSFFRKMVGYAAGTGGIGLIDVNALNRTAENNWSGILIDCISGWSCWGSRIKSFASDGVVEDENFGCSGSISLLVVCPIWKRARGAMLILTLFLTILLFLCSNHFWSSPHPRNLSLD